MLCEKCGKRQATCFLSREINGNYSEWNLCGECAKEEGLFPPSGNDGFFPSLFGSAANAGNRKGNVCPNCFMPFEEFLNSGFLGCPECYDAFSTELSPILKQMQGETRYAGKRLKAIPKRPPQTKEERLEYLRKELETAKKEERFEDAERIYREIREWKGNGHES